MFQTKTFFAALGVASLILSVSSLQATELRMNAAGDLEVLDAKGQMVNSLSNGTISQSIKADNQAFKISFGKDLRGRFTTIVYPDPEKPQTVSLTVFKQKVVVSSDAVLTVIAEKDMSSATLQSGVLGKVSVAGTDLKGGGSVQVQNGSIVANTVPAPAPAPVKQVKTVAKTAPAPVPAPVKTPAPVAVAKVEEPKPAPAPAVVKGSAPANYDGAHTRKVEGDVMIAPKGQDVVDAVKNSPTPPRLDLNETIAPGSTVQTGPTGKAYVSPFPGAVIMIEPNSTVEFEELSWKNSSGQVERKMTANVKQGSVISAIKGIKPEDIDYKVKTPHGVAAARGTVYSVKSAISDTTIVVSEGKVQVVTASGTYNVGVGAGKKITITKDGPVGGELPAEAFDIQATEAMLAAVQSFIGTNDWGTGGDGSGDGSAVAPPALDALIQTFQRSFEPDLNPAPMTPTTSN